MTVRHQNPAAEAAAKLGGATTALVLEPSPPANQTEPFFADDPAAIPADAATTVGPTSAADRTWAQVVAERPELSGWAADRWLAAYRPLSPVPDRYCEARNAYHRLAYSVIAEARRCANTKFGLRYTRGGFGTPFFGDDQQVRVQDGLLVVQQGAEVRHSAITSLRAAGEFVGVQPGTAAAEHDSPPLGDVDSDLGASRSTGAFLAEWFGFSWAVLEELRVTPGAVDAERTQLWPGHFDPAAAIGDVEQDQRATYGCSPGDDAHDEPYLYVGAWGEVDREDPYWNETTFNGASLPYAALVGTDNAVQTALNFFRAGLGRLRGRAD
ncbi:MAG: hypothetical protein F4Y27_07785 [Acidimicrobiaceae bacterium]|nr:hypothetical protein [Acidimicrobiaceae bacterium]MXW60379.1 hypothetical protein [Acidimicrobiaceae bacterium]MXW75849.1 hypothetical protein [Acidimicrobiaceae bacterium]MYA74560.1 hypothetical protein [Acidimicrobiaceae bacterium]MYC43168.1 hypothetical protein [Acidimicrobiaceae bacterium]